MYSVCLEMTSVITHLQPSRYLKTKAMEVDKVLSESNDVGMCRQIRERNSGENVGAGGESAGLELRAPEWWEMKTLTHQVERGSGRESHVPPLGSRYLHRQPGQTSALRATACAGSHGPSRGVWEEGVPQGQPALTTPMASYSHGPRSWESLGIKVLKKINSFRKNFPVREIEKKF